ncbi:MAG TPA: insulinase family protein [Arsenicitalea sp.]|jgi:hypothetical protein|nr:insulinase family protein [Arsenicitalea sp.]
MSDHPAFDLLRDQAIPEVNSTARLYRHKKTGAEILSLVNSDENKVFGVTFKTPPEDSTGVAHILEHSVLCGSRKYPVKKPFVEMLKGSMHTFLNAMTFSDKTAYPVASQNLQDFYNLVDVYLDAVFFPLISEDTFRQEGWHYELEGGNAPLTYKGVVFNEMKGAYSSPAAVLGKISQQSLYPDTTYGVNSGGDPKAIPDLTYNYFKNFHAKFYHPSNARIVFYGDDDPAERLNLIEGYLGQFERIDVNAQVGLQPRFTAPKKLTHTYAAGKDEDPKRSSMVTVNWMLDQVPDQETTLALTVLEYALVGNAAAPLRKALTDSGLGEGLTGSGLADDLRQPMFTVGLKGIDAANADKVEALILSTLERLGREGIDKLTVESALNTLEFQLRENNTGSFPRGISLMFRSMRTWLHGGDPLAPLSFEEALGRVKARLAGGERVLETLLQQTLVENQHRTTVLLNPDPEQEARETAEERARLDAVRASLDADGLAAIAESTKALKALQEAVDPPEQLAKIPTLHLADLPRQNKPIPIEETTVAGVTTLFHDLPTSGVVYLDVGFDLHTLSPDLLPYISLFSRALLQTGTKAEDFVSLSQRIGRSTGGIGPARIVSAKADGEGTAAYLFLRGKATGEKTGELLAILKDVILTARLDNKERLAQMALEEKAGFESRIAGAGNGIINSRLRASLHEADWAGEQMGGINYLFFLRELVPAIENDWPSVQAKLERIRDILVNRSGMVANVTTDAANWRALEPQLAGFLGDLPMTKASSAEWQKAPPRSEGLTFPAQVNFVAKGADLLKFGYKNTGATAVALRHLNTTYLWDRVRVQGGAYGGSANYDPYSGGFTFVSYRDPNLVQTLDAYDGAASFLKDGIGTDELTRSIIGAIGSMDSYRLPDAKGFTSLLWYLMGSSEELRQQRRDEVLNASAADFRALGDVLGEVAKAGQVVVLGSDAAIKAANDERGGFLEVTRVM